jgi:hypothetical protein
MSDTYSVAWAKYRRRQTLAIASMIGFVIFQIIAWRVTSPGHWRDVVVAVIELGILVSALTFGAHAALWPCPRCGKMFRGTFSTNCRNCGLPLGSHGS